MVEAAIYGLVAAGMAFLVTSAAMPFVRRIALAFRAIDYPGGRRHQADAIPRLGGVAVVLGLLVGAVSVIGMRWDAWNAGITNTQVIAIPLALFTIFVCGFIDDTLGLSPLIRFLLQTIAALLVTRADWFFSSVKLPLLGTLELGVLGVLISVAWIVGVTNAINFLDGLDGLAGGVTAIIASSMIVLSLWLQDFMTVLVMAAVVGACIGFLRKNWSPAQIYLGDAGSLTLGFVLALVSIRSSMKSPTAVAILVPILALGLPVIDTLLVMLYRFTRKSRGTLTRRFSRIYRPDRSHLHHLLARIGHNRSRIVILIYIVAVGFCAMALLVAASRNLTLGFILIGLEIFIVFAMRYFGMHSDALLISLKQRQGVHELYGPGGYRSLNLRSIAKKLSNRAESMIENPKQILDKKLKADQLYK